MDKISKTALFRAVSLWLMTACLMALASQSHAQTISASSWLALEQGKAIAIMRHALAPGTGDPTNFTLNDCSTQRNLSEAGRAQATRIAQTLNENGIDQADVFSSGWCRCMETAKLLDLGPVERLMPLDSFFQNRSNADRQTTELENWIQSRLGSNNGKPAILVTHQVNISALTGRGVASGELFFLTLNNREVQVIDSLQLPP